MILIMTREEKVMKKVLFGLLICLGFISTSQAGIFDDTGDRTVRVVYSTSSVAAAASTATILIDLSDTTNWPHKETREINISSLRVNFDKVAATTGTVKIGVINHVNTSTGSVTWFFDSSRFLNVSNADNDKFYNYTQNFIRTRVEGGTSGGTDALEGTTPYILSNNKTNGSTTYQSDIKLTTLTGTNTAPGRGDIVMEWSKSDQAAWNLTVEIDYNTPNVR